MEKFREKSKAPKRRCKALCSALGLLLAGIPTAASGRTVECRIIQETPDGFYVDTGSQDGLTAGTIGRVLHSGAEVAEVEVVQAARSGALTRLRGLRGASPPVVGDTVSFQTDSPAVVGTPVPSAAAAAAASDEPFQPLLDPFKDRVAQLTDPRNILHGRLRLYELFQLDQEHHLDGSLTRLGADGTLDRIQGTPWNLEWSGTLAYRDGSAFQRSTGYEEARLDVYRLSLFRKFDEVDTLRVGRFLPYQLPGVGFVDGVQGERAIDDHFRIGAIMGFKPDRIDLDVSGDEPLGVAYASVEAGKPRELYYSGTVGVLGALYKGDPDRLAFLFDQSADLGPKLTIHSSTEVDFDIGSAEVRDEVSLTRQDLYAYYSLTQSLTLKGGYDHYQRPDTEAERALLPIPSAPYFDRGFNRYWVGATQRLPSRMVLDGEVSFYDAPHVDHDPHWRAVLSRTGNILPHDYASITVFNMDGVDSRGYGFRAWASFPFLDDRFSLRPALGFRYAETDPTDKGFSVTDFSLFLDWWISKRWSVFIGWSQYVGTSLQSSTGELGVDFRF